MIAALLLAAGASQRMGRPKQLLPWGDSTLLAATSRVFLEAGQGDVVVVLGCDADRIAREARLPPDPRLRLVVHAAWADGMAGSLCSGLAAVPDADAVLVGLADQPELAPALVRAVCAAWRPGVPLVVPVHAGGTGHPVLFDRCLFDELRVLRGDVGARAVVRRHWAEAVQVVAEPVLDIDTEAAYVAALARRFGR